MKLMKIFHKKEQRQYIPRNVNPYAVYLSPKGSDLDSSSRGSGKSASGFSATSLFQRQQHQKLAEAFRIIDANGDGHICKAELRALWRNLGERVTDRELRLMIKEVDENGDGKINLQEFVNLHRKFGLGIDDHGRFSKELRFAFSMADLDGDGCISPYELQVVMRKLGVNCGVDETCAMIRCVDSERKDLISFEQFEELMTSGMFAS